MKLSIIIPFFNEEKTIAVVLKKILACKIPEVTFEIILVNDGSTDRSLAKIKSQLTTRVHLMSHKRNEGKGVAVRTGMKQAKGDYLLIQDADLEYDPKQIASLVIPVIKNNADVVYGTRLKRFPNFARDEKTLLFFIHYLGNRVLSLITSVLYGSWITDMETGYKLINRNALKGISLQSQGFEIEAELTAKLLKKGYYIVEVPIVTTPRGYQDGKKLKTFRDGKNALVTLLKYRVVN